MRKRRISLLAIDEKIINFFINELNDIFGNMLEINYYTPSMNPKPYIYDTDLIIYTDPSILIAMMSYIKCEAPTLMMKRTISREALEKLKKIPSNSKCLVANINSFMANETLTTIYQLGINQVTLYPFYKGLNSSLPEVNYIITPEKYDFLPKIKAKIIVIGNRVFDISTILDIIAFLNIDSRTADNIIRRYLFRVPSFWQGIKYTLENKKTLSLQWKTLLNELSEAVMVVDVNDEITLTNNRAFEILGLSKEVLEHTTLNNVVAKNPELNNLLSEKEIDNELLIFNQKKLVITIKKVEFDGTSYGKVIIINLYNDMVKIQQKIHRQIIGKGYFSKYTFGSIIGKHDKISQVKRISKKIANSDSTILISGETGTGKELLAGAIHNFSPRSNNPFVAVNCATLPENLLESELFGYEEGAFTGAKKGGKIGMFEIAHNGTLFLDEIGELPLKLQARLLRALQEKEIMRLGGDSIIKVNTRIIAATNKNLFQMVKNGQFREDLFFRLNIFQINIPPLRERITDIPILINYFLEKSETKRKINKDFEMFYKNYKWLGNIRELFNVLEYILKTSDGNLSFSNLPEYLKQKKYINGKNTLSEVTTDQLCLLKVLKKRQENYLSTGRRNLCLDFNKLYYDISELEVRKQLEVLANKGYLIINKGRKGCEITEKGKSILEKYDE